MHRNCPRFALRQKGAECVGEVYEKVEELGGTMPEDLPTPDKSIKTLENHQKKLTNKE